MPLVGAVFAIFSAITLSVYFLGIALLKQGGIPPNAAGFFGHIVSVSAVIAIVTLRGNWGDVALGLRRFPGHYIAIAVLGASIAVAGINGLSRSGLTSLGILASTDILFTILFGWLLFHERIRKVSLIAILVIFAGGAIRVHGHQKEVAEQRVESAAQVSGDGSAMSEEAIKALRWQRLLGDTFAIYYALALALNAFIIKRLMRDVSWDAILLGNHVLRVIAFGSIAWATGEAAAGWDTATANFGIGLLALGCGALLIVQMVMYYQGLRRAPVWVVKMFLMSGPLYYLGFDWLVFGNPPRPNAYIGAALVMGGAIFVLLTDPLFRKNGPPVPAAPGDD